MINHAQNLKQYIAEDLIYGRYKENKDAKFNDFEKYDIQHIEDIKWVLDELEALYELVEELKKKGN